MFENHDAFTLPMHGSIPGKSGDFSGLPRQFHHLPPGKLAGKLACPLFRSNRPPHLDRGGTAINASIFDDLETFFVYPLHLEDHLPPVAIPLLPGDLPVTIDLQAIFDRCYDAGPYAREIRYGEDAVIPPLQIDKAAWALQILQADLG